MSPIVSIVGKSKSGKTTLIENLIEELKSRGYRVATIKHAPEGMTFEVPDKDNWRHIQAGSEATAISSSDKIVLIKPIDQDATLDEAASLFGDDYDIILTEGFKKGNAPKIEVHRKECGPLFDKLRKRIAVVADEPLEVKIRQFSSQDIKGLADLLEKGFIKPQRERTSLYINNTPVPLNSFAKSIITTAILAMVSSLKGVGEVKSLKFLVRRKPG
ncbi:MAG: molybdopterin-guanine dinucleotide biosynthesis protein B [Dehalococcoidales bacterium]|jgi:molybdopterin-guanine dinucleotide biosynthesis protein MobB|nr:molybdopterin-guanine dinucleotide biosynthesis protein B [Dehalococcoidales bacterium]